MEKLKLDYLYGHDLSKFRFYQVPKLLINDEAFESIEYGAKLLYAMMIDRASCSATKGDDFADKQGRIYIIFTVEQIMGAMRCSNKTAIKMTKQLEGIGLIERKKRGQGKADIIYVKDFSSILHILKCNIYTSKNELSSHLAVNNLHRSNTNRNNLNRSEPSVPPISPQAESLTVKKAVGTEQSVCRSSTLDDQFESFWDAFPRKRSKNAALKSFLRLKPDQELFRKMLSAIEVQKSSREWRKNNGQYIPNPAKWLNEGRWNDEVTQFNQAVPLAESESEIDEYARLSMERLSKCSSQ